MDLSDISLDEITATTDLQLINEAVHSPDFNDREAVALNPLLTVDQCSYLWSNLYPESDSTDTLFYAPSFPEDILMRLALSPDAFYPEFIKLCMGHPKATEEMQVLFALKILSI